MDAGVPESVALAVRAMAALPTDWALCGGWAVDAWLGRETRDHLDVDLSLFHDAQAVVLQHFPDDWLLNGHDEADEETTAPWDGRTLAHPGHIHAYGPGGLHLDIQLDRRCEGSFVFSTQPEILLPIDRCILDSVWHLPTLVPEALLFFKGVSPIRAHDTADMLALVPTLAKPARVWLADALRAVRPDHEWLPILDVDTSTAPGNNL